MKRILALALLAAGLAACKDDPTGPGGAVVIPSVGDELQLNVNFSQNCDNPVLRTGRVVAVTDQAVVVADNANPASGFSPQEYLEFGAAFDEVVWPISTRVFGEPDDMDRNGRVLLFFTRAINDLTQPGSGSYINGLFYSRDLFPRRRAGNLSACAASNAAEMIYLMVPDESRGGPFTKDRVAQVTVGVMAHELQHLTSASRRLYKLKAPQDGWNEVVWLNEGMSHIAEELVFYDESGLAPRRNIDRPTLQSSATVASAFNAYALPNFARLSSHLTGPERNSPYEADDDLATRGAIWQFLRYAADQRGGSETELWNRLLNSTTTGMTNLKAAFGTEPVPLFRDWAVSVYLDDAVSGAEARFTQPSWDFRSVFTTGTGSGFPLRVHRLRNGASQSVHLATGGSAYLRFGVAPGGRADVRAVPEGSTAQGACVTVPALQVGRVHNFEAGQGQALCVDGGAGGGDYTLVAFYGAYDPAATASSEPPPLNVQMLVSGIQELALQPTPSRSLFEGPTFTLGGATIWREDPSIEHRIREQERELDRLVLGGGGARLSRSAAAASADPTKLYLSVVRTR